MSLSFVLVNMTEKARIEQLLALNEKLTLALSNKEKKIAVQQQTIQKQRAYLEELIKKYILRKKDSVNNPNQLQFDFLEELIGDLLDTVMAEEKDQEVEPEVKPVSQKKSPKTKKKGGRNEIPPHFERVINLIDIPEDEKVDPINGQPLRFVRYEDTERYDILPSRVIARVDRRPVYALPKNKGFHIAELPESPLPKSQVTNAFLAFTAVSRFQDHLPYYRIAQMMEREGVNLHRNSYNQNMISLAEGPLKRLHQALKEDIMHSSYVGFDDTPVKIQIKGTGALQEVRMWTLLDKKNSQVYFEFSYTKQTKAVNKLMDGYTGVAQADALHSHNQFMAQENVTELGCWAHTIRKFKKAQTETNRAGDFVCLIQEMYKIDRMYADAGKGIRADVKKQQVKPLMNKIFNQAFQLKEEGKVLPKSFLGQAITYLLNQRQPLENYLELPELKLDNNDVERSLRPLGIGRKNWGCFGSARGARTCAVFLSLINSCKNLNINPFLYIKDILDRIMTEENLRELLPAYWKVSEQNKNLPLPKDINGWL